MNYREVSPAPVLPPPIIGKTLRFLGVLLLLLVWPISLAMNQSGLAQTKPLSGSQLDDYLKSLLAEYYTGKMVYAKVDIPATERGLQIMDGRLEVTVAGKMQVIAARPGAVLVIRQLTFKSKNIEVQFEGNET